MSQSVLIIDSDEPSVKLARAVLESDGWRVIHAPNRAHAREVLAQLRPNLIITALVVPRQAALDLVRELVHTAAGVPIVAVTSLNGPETEYRALEAGCSGFIQKPISVSTFSAQLRSFLGDQL